MKYLKQLAIIGLITLVGEMLNYFLPLPVPASVYGMVLLFLCLCTGIIKEVQIKETADMLLVLMPVMFTGPSVGIIENYTSISESLAAFLLVIVITTVFIMAVTSAVTQSIMKFRKTGENSNE